MPAWKTGALIVPLLAHMAASAADVTFTESYSESGRQTLSDLKLHGRTVSVSGDRYAIRIEDVTLIADPAARQITLVDHAHRRFHAGSMDAFEQARAAAEEPLKQAQQAALANTRWSDAHLEFATPADGPETLGVPTRTLGWTITARSEVSDTGIVGIDVIRMSIRMTAECDVGKPTGWETVRRFQNLDALVAFPGSPSSELDQALKDVAAATAAAGGALLHCVNRIHADLEPIPTDPSSERSLAASPLDYETVIGISALTARADPAIFEPPPSYVSGDVEIEPQFLPALPADFNTSK